MIQISHTVHQLHFLNARVPSSMNQIAHRHDGPAPSAGPTHPDTRPSPKPFQFSFRLCAHIRGTCPVVPGIDRRSTDIPAASAQPWRRTGCR